MIKKFLITLSLMLCIVVVGCSDDNTSVVEPQPVNKQEMQKKDITVVVYRIPANGGDYLIPEKINLVRTEKTSAPEAALEALITTEPKDSKMASVFPQGMKVLGFKLEQGVAVVDFNKAIMNIGSGSYAELMATTAIVNTLTEFPEIKKVRITVEGQKVATLKGHTDLLDPLERNTDMIKK